MPYLHWDYLDAFKTARAKHTNPCVHPRRSLDETYNFLSQTQLDARNESQVVNRAYQLAKSPKTAAPTGPAPLMVVDQLWLWIVDESIIPTPISSPLDFIFISILDSILHPHTHFCLINSQSSS